MNKFFDAHIIKFGLVGVLGMVIDFSVTWVCKEILRWNKYISNSLGFSLAVTNNFLLNRFWTFGGSTQPIGTQFVKFAVVSVSGLLINNLLLYLLVKNTKKNFYLLKLIVIGIVFFWNYFVNFLFTFN